MKNTISGSVFNAMSANFEGAIQCDKIDNEVKIGKGGGGGQSHFYNYSRLQCRKVSAGMSRFYCESDVF
jgi:hypothetical protein